MYVTSSSSIGLSKTIFETPFLSELNFIIVSLFKSFNLISDDLQQLRCRFFMGKHYTTEFKLQILRPILNREMSIREAARFYNIPSNALVGTWLKRFEKSGIKGLIPRKPSGRPPMKPKYARMPPPPKTEEDRLRLRILQLEAEVAYLKELRRLRLQDEAEQRKLSKG